MPLQVSGVDFDDMRPYYRFMQILTSFLFKFFFRLQVFGQRHIPTEGGALLLCNHQSFLDPMLAGVKAPRECNFMARDSLFHNPFFGRLITSVNAFPVRRGAGDVGAVKQVLRHLKADRLVVVFPEGTRTRDGSMGRINPNTLSLARRAGVAVVPTVISGAFEAWPRQRKLPRPKKVLVSYCPPIPPETLQQLSDEQLSEQLTDSMQRELARLDELRR